MTEWKPEIHSLLELLLNAPYGSKPFWISAAIAGGTLLIFGWLISSFIFSASRGFLITFIAQAIPGAAAIAGSVAVTIYAVPELNAGPVRDYLPLAGAIFAAFLSTMLLSRFLLGIKEGSAILAVIFTYACVAGAIFLGHNLVESVDSGMQNLEEKKEQRESDTNSILGY